MFSQVSWFKRILMIHVTKCIMWIFFNFLNLTLSVSYCCLIYHPKTKWLKTIILFSSPFCKSAMLGWVQLDVSSCSGWALLCVYGSCSHLGNSEAVDWDNGRNWDTGPSCLPMGKLRQREQKAAWSLDLEMSYHQFFYMSMVKASHRPIQS